MSKTIKRPQQHYDLYEVIWNDAAGLRHGWLDRTEKPVAQLVISVGFLIIEDPEHIIIAQDTDDTGAHNGRTQIPRGMVKKMKLLRKKDNAKLSSSVRATELSHTLTSPQSEPTSRVEKPALKDSSLSDEGRSFFEAPKKL